MALGRLILGFGIRKGLLDTNLLDRLTKNRTVSEKRYLTHQEMALAVENGRKFGGACLIVALALKTARLCIRRSVEVRALTRDALTNTGIMWQDGKDTKRKKAAVLIEWSPQLQDTTAEATAFKRNILAGTMFVFGNMRGQRCTKGG